MGFYSFYRIFKDIIKTLFGNKAFKYFLIFAIICFVVLFANRTFAAEPVNYVVDYYTTSYSIYPRDTTGYFYWYIPVFANSSYSISWASGTTLSFSFIDNISRIDSDDTFYQILNNNYIYSNNQGSYGYFAVKDGYLVVTQREYDFPNKVNLTILTDYDYTSNLATIHNDLVNLMNAIQGSDDIPASASSSTISGLSVSNGGGNGSFQSGSSSIIYYELDPDKVNNFDFTITTRYPGFSHVYGYCNAIPSPGVAYNFLGACVNATEYNNVTASVPKGAKYFFVRLNGSNSTYILNSYTVGYGGLDEVNQQVINQGNQTRDTLTDSNISQDTADYTLPSDNTNDITQEGFNSIFERIRSTFTSGSATPLVVTIPFTNKSFTISYDTVYSSANLGLVRSIIESFWWFVISLFITKDIFKKIEKIKTGNIEFTETTNIKEDIL